MIITEYPDGKPVLRLCYPISFGYHGYVDELIAEALVYFRAKYLNKMIRVRKYAWHSSNSILAVQRVLQCSATEAVAYLYS